jgi:hypothetical protein
MTCPYVVFGNHNLCSRQPGAAGPAPTPRAPSFFIGNVRLAA